MINRKRIPTEFMFMRQEGIVPHNVLDSLNIHIIGAGGIGSPTALILAKMGCPHITVYDGDRVMPHNLPSTFYPLKAIKVPKVKALRKVIKEYTGTKINYEVITFIAKADLFYRLERENNVVVISAVDNMETRKLIWDSSKDAEVRLYVEGRMGGTQGRIYTVDPSDGPKELEKYETTLYSEEEVLEVPCTAKSIIFNTTYIGSIIANQIRLWATKQSYHRDILFDLNNMNIIAKNKKTVEKIEV